MAKITGSNTKPEIRLRRALWRAGYRYLVKNSLPGNPDLVFTRQRLAVFVDGCFWHRCPIHYQAPTTNAYFWETKIAKNVDRDERVNSELREIGWTVLRIWEHEIKKDLDGSVNKVISVLHDHRV